MIPPPRHLGRSQKLGRASDRESGTSRASADRLPVYLPPSADPGRTSLTGTGMSVPVPASTALPGSHALMRALRPLKLRGPDIRRRTLDETATVEATARSGALMPVLRAESERRFSLALVVDTGPAMAVWTKLEAELLVALQRFAAFRDLQRWYLYTDRVRVLGVSHSARANPALRDPAELLDPSGRRVILVLTDSAGLAWYSGAMARTLRMWGYGGPVAILQPLPQQLWPRTALSPVRGRLTAARQAAPNAELEFTPRGRAVHWHQLLDAAKNAAAPPPLPVPVLEIGPEWLRGWARLVGVSQGATLDCAVTLAPAAPLRNPPHPHRNRRTPPPKTVSGTSWSRPAPRPSAWRPTWPPRRSACRSCGMSSRPCCPAAGRPSSPRCCSADSSLPGAYPAIWRNRGAGGTSSRPACGICC